MNCLLVPFACVAFADPAVTSINLDVRFDPPAHHALVAARLRLNHAAGEVVLRLSEHAEIRLIRAGGIETLFSREGDLIRVHVTGQEEQLDVLYEATFEQDVAAGERAGQIHNLSVDAHVGERGVFLSDGAAWHPKWIDDEGVAHLVEGSINIEPLEGWAFVASGEPAVEGASLDAPVWRWHTPRPVEGIAVAGNRHVVRGRVHGTEHGPVEIAMHVPAEHESLAPLFIDAAASYLDLYVPLLGPFPYRRFTIAENFFSSGFAYPGFTLLGPRVVAMGERALGPGYLDHELVHNWWGNGVYVDPAGGNWCEALTSYCANYYRRVAEGGEDAGREYRRAVLMRLSSDPDDLDNAPPSTFGVDPATSRFVGYDKGAFIFTMLEHGPGVPAFEIDRTQFWLALRRFAQEHLGRRASWTDLERSIETQFGESRETFFRTWVRERSVPTTPREWKSGTLAEFTSQLSGDEVFDIGGGRDDGGAWREIDPDFRVYRVLPPDQIIPTLAGTFGADGVRIETGPVRPDAAAFLETHESLPDGAHLLLIGTDAVEARRDLIARTSDPIEIADDGGFAVGGTAFSDPSHAVLHTMQHPDRPGRFITVFLSVGEAGWSRLRLIDFYSRDSTVVWEGDRVIERRVFEPSRRIRVVEE